MADIWSRKKRSDVMSRIRAKNTKPEVLLRSLLHRMGFRYRLHVRDLPGDPDLLFPKFRAAIFVNGCFWHMHKKCNTWKMPRSNTRYWRQKLERNVERDLKNLRHLRRLGWRVKVVWECELERDPCKTALVAKRFVVGL